MATPDDIAAVQRWASTEDRRRLLADAVGDRRSDFQPRQAKVWASLAMNISKKTASGATNATGGKRPFLGTQPLRRQILYTVTSLLVATFIFVIGFASLGHRSIHSRSTLTTYTTANGERANITLPDGSTVALDVGSRLEVPTDYVTGHHTVRLLGAALFDVDQHDGAPFTVEAGRMSTRVLGTTFMVRHYRNDSTTIVAVREGKVAIGPVVVTTSHYVAMTPQGGIQEGRADSSLFGFASGVMVLTTQPLAQAIPELNRWYAADIRLADSSLARVPVDGRFVAGSLSDLASILELMLNTRVVRDGQVLTLYPRTR